jgi:predicted dehydrogenase
MAAQGRDGFGTIRSKIVNVIDSNRLEHDVVRKPLRTFRHHAPGDAVIRVGIVGSNFGRTILLPAFRADPRCEVAGLAGRDAEKAAGFARDAGIPRSFKTWAELVEDEAIDAIAIATPPALQPDIAIQALSRGKAVFLEKPLAATIAQADALLEQAELSKRPVMVDFEFPELPSWQQAKALMDRKSIGKLRHVVVSWQVENHATRMRLKSWKTSGDDGGGVLGNFVSHCFHYLEYFCGPLANLSAQLFGLPGERNASEAIVALTGEFESGAGLSLSMSAASYLGSGHRVEFYGEDGTLMLINTTADYMRGFELLYAHRPAEKLARVEVKAADDSQFPDGRIAPVSRLAGRFLDAIEKGGSPTPGIREGHRVQHLIELARLSHDVSESVTTDA